MKNLFLILTILIFGNHNVFCQKYQLGIGTGIAFMQPQKNLKSKLYSSGIGTYSGIEQNLFFDSNININLKIGYRNHKFTSGENVYGNSFCGGVDINNFKYSNFVFPLSIGYRFTRNKQVLIPSFGINNNIQFKYVYESLIVEDNCLTNPNEDRITIDKSRIYSTYLNLGIAYQKNINENYLFQSSMNYQPTYLFTYGLPKGFYPYKYRTIEISISILKIF